MTTATMTPLPPRVFDLRDRRFERLVVVRFLGVSRLYGGAQWECRCDCGRMHSASSGALKAGNIRSCGCLRDEVLSRPVSVESRRKMSESQRRRWAARRAAS